MKSTFLVNVESPEMRIAEIRDGRLFDFTLERDGRLLGNIFKARVENILPGMDAAFVNIGLARNALVYAGDIGPADATGNDRKVTPIETLVHVGDEILVQIARPPVGTKGARVTTRLSLPGRFAVLVANTETNGVSRRIESDEERSRLRKIADRVRPLDHGVIIRTEAEGVSEPELVRDIEMLREQLQALRQTGARETAPALLHQDFGALGRLARDRFSDKVEAVIIDNEEVFNAFGNMIRRVMPAYEKLLQLHQGPQPLFDAYRITKELEVADERIVPLPSGAYLTIDEAEALTAIDVNTGKFVGKHRLADTVLKTNMEAVEEITRQLRLRDIGGVIVIDFIDMERTRDRIQVMNALDAALKEDPTRTRIVQISPLGLVEMTRRREGFSLRQLCNRPCPYCNGDGVVKTATSVAIECRRRVREISARLADKGVVISVTLHPDVAVSFIGSDVEHVQALEKTTGVQVELRVDANLHYEANGIEVINPAVAPPKSYEFVAGARLQLPPGTPFYPEGAPQCTALYNTLINLVNLEDSKFKPSQSAQPSMIEIIDVNRWMVNARVLAFTEK